MACKASDSCHSRIRTSPRVIWEPSFSLPGFLPAHWSRLSGAAQIRLLGLAVRAFCEPMPGHTACPVEFGARQKQASGFEWKWHYLPCRSTLIFYTGTMTSASPQSPPPHTLTWSHVYRMDMQNGRLWLQNANELVLRCGYRGSWWALEIICSGPQVIEGPRQKSNQEGSQGHWLRC